LKSEASKRDLLTTGSHVRYTNKFELELEESSFMMKLGDVAHELEESLETLALGF
jgi:hypothetical protein